MSHDPQPLDYAAAPPPIGRRPQRLIHQSYAAAALCLLTVWADFATGLQSSRVGMLLALLSFYGIGVAVASFVEGGSSRTTAYC